MNAAAAQTPARVSHQIYAASQQGEPIAFLLWHATPGLAEDRNPGRVSLLHSISHYVSRMGRPTSKWDDRTFANQGDVSYGTAPLEMWYPTYLHLASAVYIPRAASIDTSLAGYPNVTLLGTYGTVDAGDENIRCCKTVYVPAPYVGLLLSKDLSPVEAWNRLCGEIVDAGAEATCRPIIDWLRAAIVRSGPNKHSTLMVPNALAPLTETLFLQHRHRLLLIHLPGPRTKHQPRVRNTYSRNGWRGDSGAEGDADREQAGPGQEG